MNPMPTGRTFIRVPDDVRPGARAVVYGCQECDWLTGRRDYKGQPGRADRSAQGACRGHMRASGHERFWSSRGSVKAFDSE